MRSLLSVLVEEAWVPMDGTSVVWFPFESRASCSGRENQTVAQDEVGRAAECSETTVFGGSEGVQVGGTADDLQKSVRGGSRRGLERPGRSVGEGQVNSQGCSRPVHHLDTQLSGEVTSSLEQHRRPGRMKEVSSEFSREPHTLSILPIRAHVDEVKSLKRCDVYIGRGCKERLLMPSFWANSYKVACYGRTRCLALHKREIEEDPQYERRIHELTEKRLLCHCRMNQSCHGDNLIQLYLRVYPDAYDRRVTDRVPTSAELNALAEARNECTDSEESELDAEIASAPQGWRGNHSPLMVGAGYTEREVCDGQGLCSPGRWAHEDRVYPSSSYWREIQRMFIHTAETMTTSRHLSELALGRLTSSPFSKKTVGELLHSLLSAAGDPEVKMHEFAVGVRVGPGTKLPRCPQIYSTKKKWRMQEQREQQEVDEQFAARGVWNTNYSSVHPIKHHVLDVLWDQAKRGQVLVLNQQVAKSHFPGLVVASMGAVKKEKDGVISARVVFDGTNGSYVNSSTHLRDQERSPSAGDIKRFMREKARVGELTIGLTADIKEAHRQIPIHPLDWHMLGSQLEPEGEVFINTVGTFGISSASYWWSRVSTAMGRLYQDIIARYASSWVLLFADDYHIEMGGDRTSDQRSWCSSFYATSCVVLCPGRRRQVVWSRTGWDLSFFSKNTRSVSRSVELPGSSLGPEKQQTQRWCTSGPLRRRWAEQSSLPAPSSSSGLSFRLSTLSAAPSLAKVLVLSRLTCPSSCVSSRVRLRGTGTRRALQKQGKSR